MKTVKLILMTAIFATMSMGVANAQSNNYTLLNSDEITVKPGHNAAFVEGVKQYKACYLENEGEGSWNMWRRQQGTGNVYVLTGSMAKWAEMEEEDAAGQACYMIYLNLIFPHIESQATYTSTSMPEYSTTVPEGTKYASVTYYEVSNESAFTNVVSTVSDAIKKKEGDFRASWYNIALAGPEAADFFAATFHKSFSELDVKRDTPAKIYTDLVGEDKAQELWDIWFSTLQNSWSFTYKLETELSN